MVPLTAILIVSVVYGSRTSSSLPGVVMRFNSLQQQGRGQADQSENQRWRVSPDQAQRVHKVGQIGVVQDLRQHGQVNRVTAHQRPRAEHQHGLVVRGRFDCAARQEVVGGEVVTSMKITTHTSLSASFYIKRFI